jgi:hypothetical protein
LQCSRRPPLVSVFKQMNFLHALPPHFFEVQFSIIPIYARFFKCLLSFTIRIQKLYSVLVSLYPQPSVPLLPH